MSFKNTFHDAGLRGLSVFAATERGEPPTFVLQYRSVDAGTELRPTGEDVLLTLVGDSVIVFCPWCGVRLSKSYRKSISELDRSDLRIWGWKRET